MEVLGIDIGGTGIKGAIVNVTTGELVSERHRIPTPEGAKPSDVADVVGKMVAYFDWKGKVGCGFPTIISDGKARSTGNIDESWLNVQVDKLFEEKTGLEFSIANDADVAGLAEMKMGAGKYKHGVVILITIGTGLGSGVFVDGKLVPNVELGTVPYKTYKRFEYYAADSARKREDLSYKEWGKRFNKFLRFTEQTFSPDLIILGGGASKKMEKFEKEFTVNVPVVPAKYKNNAGIIGAAMTAIQ
jgi:polyphosphate glucokinase